MQLYLEELMFHMNDTSISSMFTTQIIGLCNLPAILSARYFCLNRDSPVSD